MELHKGQNLVSYRRNSDLLQILFLEVGQIGAKLANLFNTNCLFSLIRPFNCPSCEELIEPSKPQQVSWSGMCASFLGRLSFPRVCHLWYKCRGRPDKNDAQGHRVDVWRSDTFTLYSCRAAFWIQETLPRLPDVDCFHGSALTYIVLAVFSGFCHLHWTSSTLPLNIQVCHYMYFTSPPPH